MASFLPPADNEIQLLTLHKAKGLEFDIVFHLNLYQWILPQYKGDYSQDLNLHYVGITRAKKCCVLCTSTHRQSNGHINPSLTVVKEKVAIITRENRVKRPIFTCQVLSTATQDFVIAITFRI